MTHYMISYVDSDPGRLTHGNVEVHLPQPIREMNEVDSLTHRLRDNFGLSRPIILGFSRFEEDR